MVIPGNSAGRSAKSVTCEEIAAKVGFDRTQQPERVWQRSWSRQRTLKNPLGSVGCFLSDSTQDFIRLV
jgi:hypothetical protein